MNDPMTAVYDNVLDDVERDAKIARSEKVVERVLNEITAELAKINCDRCNGTVLRPDPKTKLFMGHPCPCADRITDPRDREEFRYRMSQRGRIINFGD